MHLLLFETAYERIRGQLGPWAEPLKICLMTKDGRLLIDGQESPIENFEPELAWLSMDMMQHRKTAEFANIVSNSSALKWLQTANAGLDNPIYKKIAKTGTRLSNSSAQAVAIAEYVLAEVLYHFQGMAERQQAQSENTWRYRPFREISGSKWLVIGFGHIGSRVAERARAFGATIVGVRESGQAHPMADKIIQQADVLAELPSTDVLVLACPITPDTHHMVNEPFLSTMKTDSVLVNIARGDLIDEPALLTALASGCPAHAALDVFSVEPLPSESPFWQHPKVAVTAHTSNAGSGLLQRGDELFVSNLARYLKAEPLLNEVDMGKLV